MPSLVFLKDKKIKLFDFPPRFTEEERSIKKYLEGRLENDKITKLKEIGILS